jgi:hypothetical protein
MKNRKTTPILNGTYEVIGLVPGPCGSKLGMVDLSKLTPAKAQKLVDINFPYLRKAKPKPTRKKKEARLPIGTDRVLEETPPIIADKEEVK